MFYIFASLPKAWSGGRVARQWSAKPRTAVRIRSRPQKVNSKTGVGFFCFLILYLFIFIMTKKRRSNKSDPQKTKLTSLSPKKDVNGKQFIPL